MLRTDLHDTSGLLDRIARGFDFLQHIAHRLLAVRVLSGLHGGF